MTISRISEKNCIWKKSLFFCQSHGISIFFGGSATGIGGIATTSLCGTCNTLWQPFGANAKHFSKLSVCSSLVGTLFSL